MTSSEPDYSTWFTKEQAATAIHVSTKTIEQYAKDGKIQQARWKRPLGGPRLAMYHPEDVNRLAHRPSKAFVVTAPAATEGNGHDLAPVAASTDGAAILQAVIRAVQKASESSEKLFLTIPEAAAFTGLTESYIRRACNAGTFNGALRDGGWKIPRPALLALV